MKNERQLISTELIEKKIYLIREQKTILDRDLAELFGMETKELKKAVKSNLDRFPSDFMLVLTACEYENIRNMSGTLNKGVTFKYLPFAFTEQGIAMIPSVIENNHVIAVTMEILRTFVRLRYKMSSHIELVKKLEILEHKINSQFRFLFIALRAFWIAIYKIRLMQADLHNQQANFRVKKTALFMR